MIRLWTRYWFLSFSAYYENITGKGELFRLLCHTHVFFLPQVKCLFHGYYYSSSKESMSEEVQTCLSSCGALLGAVTMSSLLILFPVNTCCTFLPLFRNIYFWLCGKELFFFSPLPFGFKNKTCMHAYTRTHTHTHTKSSVIFKLQSYVSFLLTTKAVKFNV